ncbi:family 1 glycosylhydrolase, partial [Enterococcus faecalis]|uniref:family 1 glycosylhydrolase n=1 Tax=Enterococcus faecalis TaxID=1351 RepID=UPI003CC53104
NQEFNYYCTDVQVRGEYPAYAERIYQKFAVKDLVIEEGDLELLKENPVDYIGFSYYMSTADDVTGTTNDTANGNLLGGD